MFFDEPYLVFSQAALGVFNTAIVASTTPFNHVLNVVLLSADNKMVRVYTPTVVASMANHLSSYFVNMEAMVVRIDHSMKRSRFTFPHFSMVPIFGNAPDTFDTRPHFITTFDSD